MICNKYIFLLYIKHYLLECYLWDIIVITTINLDNNFGVKIIFQTLISITTYYKIIKIP